MFRVLYLRQTLLLQDLIAQADFCRPMLQTQLLLALSSYVIKLDSKSAIASIREKFSEKLTLILSDELCGMRSQYVWLTKPNLSNLSVPELRYCILYFDDVSTEDVKSKLTPEQLIWLSTNDLAEIEEEVNEIYESLTSNITNDYKTIIMTHLGIRRFTPHSKFFQNEANVCENDS